MPAKFLTVAIGFFKNDKPNKAAPPTANSFSAPVILSIQLLPSPKVLFHASPINLVTFPINSTIPLTNLPSLSIITFSFSVFSFLLNQSNTPNVSRDFNNLPRYSKNVGAALDNNPPTLFPTPVAPCLRFLPRAWSLINCWFLSSSCCAAFSDARLVCNITPILLTVAPSELIALIADPKSDPATVLLPMDIVSPLLFGAVTNL